MVNARHVMMIHSVLKRPKLNVFQGSAPALLLLLPLNVLLALIILIVLLSILNVHPTVSVSDVRMILNAQDFYLLQPVIQAKAAYSVMGKVIANLNFVSY